MWTQVIAEPKSMDFCNTGPDNLFLVTQMHFLVCFPGYWTAQEGGTTMGEEVTVAQHEVSVWTSF